MIRLILPVYAVTSFVSAFLLFLIQPMIAKQLLPMLGGAPSVWNTVMVFFQTALLGGYLYAHISARFLPAGIQAVIQAAALFTAALTLPFVLPHASASAIAETPIRWLLVTLAGLIGLPFLALAANAPMLQHWVSRTAHPQAENPYFLYAASNAGSLLALLSYPVIVEPYLRVGEQTQWWSWGYGMLVAMIVLCGILGRKCRKPVETRRARKEPATGETITWRRRGYWVLLAFVPSSMMLGVTTYITTDIAPVPLFWVFPLALYLLSFILVFARRPILYGRSVEALFPLALITAAMSLFPLTKTMTALGDLHLCVLFAAAMTCHGRLAADKPGPERLTEFYLWLSLGGMLGGMFNGLLAPVIFDRLWEYPAVFVLACMLHPSGLFRGAKLSSSWREAGVPAIAAAAYGIGMYYFDASFLSMPTWPMLDSWLNLLNPWRNRFVLPSKNLALILLYALPLVGAVALRRRPLAFAAAIGVLFFLGTLSPVQHDRTLLTERNFFGQIEVKEDASGGTRTLMHGSTIHGAQYTDAGKETTPLVYFHPSSPVGEFFASLPARFDDASVGIVGLGTGAISCLLRRRQSLTYYDINPLVADIAVRSGFFTYLKRCKPETRIVLGDARLALEKEPESSLDIFIVDAFSSDAIPIHLLTQEALALYLRKLKPGGILVFHISNRYLRLEYVLSAESQKLGLHGMFDEDTNPRKNPEKSASTWVVLSAPKEPLRWLENGNKGWSSLPEPLSTRQFWTDDYSNLFSAFRMFLPDPGKEK